MQEALTTLDTRLNSFDDLFFKWLLRVLLAGTLAGSAWIDDAPPLDAAATGIALYVAFRLLTQFVAFRTVAPVENGTLTALFAVASIVTLALCFMTTVTLVESIALFVVD